MTTVMVAEPVNVLQTYKCIKNRTCYCLLC